MELSSRQRLIVESIGDVAWGVAACSILAGIAYATDAGRAERKTGLSFGTIVLLYASAGLTGGAIYGALRPATGSGFRKYAAAAAGALPGSVLLLLWAYKWQLAEFGRGSAVVALAMACFAGPFFVAYNAARFGKRESAKPDA